MPDASQAFLVIREHKGKVFFEAKWRDSTRAQRKRRLGPAWLEKNERGVWVKPSGRVETGFLDERRAHVEMARVIADHEEALRLTPENRAATFDDAASAWVRHLEGEKRVRPSTLKDYGYMLRAPKPGDKKKSARLMRTFGGEELATITTADVQRFLAGLDREGLAARNVNKFRQVLHAIFAHAMRSDSFGLRVNPVSETTRRPEGGAKPIEVFEPDEVRAIAKAAADQDGELFTVAAFTGLRLGELLALKWSDVGLEEGRLIVARAVSAGEEVASTKSRRHRVVPLADQAAEALKRLSERGDFTSRGDHVFCRSDGRPLDRAVVRRRFIEAQETAGVRVRRFHDLRHTFGSLAVRSFDPVSVQALMGHSSLQVTERYLHSRPRKDDAAKLTDAFA